MYKHAISNSYGNKKKGETGEKMRGLDRRIRKGPEVGVLEDGEHDVGIIGGGGVDSRTT